jgi:hypothetical protein
MLSDALAFVFWPWSGVTHPLIDPGIVQELRDHRKRQAEERLRVGPEWRGTDDYVFSTARGEPIHPTRCHRS